MKQYLFHIPVRSAGTVGGGRAKGNLRKGRGFTTGREGKKRIESQFGVEMELQGRVPQLS